MLSNSTFLFFTYLELMELKNYFPLETVIHNLSDIIQASNAPVTWWHLRFNRWWMESGPITIVRCSERENPPVAWVQHGAGQEWEVKWGRSQLRGIKTIKHIRSAPLLPFTLICATVWIVGSRSILFQPLCQGATHFLSLVIDLGFERQRVECRSRASGGTLIFRI